MHTTTTPAPAARPMSPKVSHVYGLVEALQEALAACNVGPLRATIDSDGNAIVEPLTGLPLSRKRTVGVSTLMLRTSYGPHPLPRDIIVEVR